MSARGDRFEITGGRPLRGRIEVNGSKNAALYTLPAALLTAGEVRLRNVPEISDIGEMAELLRALGAEVTIDGTDVVVRAAELSSAFAPVDLVESTRASFLIMGPTLARLGEGGCPSPGGDAIGVRPVDVHLAGFRALGAEVTREGAYHVARGTNLRGGRVFLDYPSVLGTVNVLFAATLADGDTTIVNAAAEPEIAMVADLLCAMGARIQGQGTGIVRVQGVERLHGADFTVMPDRIEAGTLLSAALATGGDLEVVGAEPFHLDSLLTKLAEAQTPVEITPDGVRLHVQQRPRAVQVQAVPYPGFPTDLHAPFAAALTQAEGVSIVHERVFDNRLMYVAELRRMGARMTTGGNFVMIDGPAPLVGSPVRALDVRAGASAMIAGLCAAGTTVISDVQHIDRGYANIVARLQSVGADIRRLPATVGR